MKKVFVCSPLRGNIHENILKAKAYSRLVIKHGFLPIAPHIYFTQFLNDEKPAERKLGLKMGRELLKLCEELWIFGNLLDKISNGMASEITFARKHDIKIKDKRI